MEIQRLAPIYEELAAAYEKESDKIIIAELNADEEKDIAKKYDIKGYPVSTFFFFFNIILFLNS